jgi:hypothetical protein
VRSLNLRVRWALIYLTATWKQAKTVRVKTTKDGIVILNSRGFRTFQQPGTLKKDKIYSALYGYCGVRLILHRVQKETSGGGYEDDFNAG